MEAIDAFGVGTGAFGDKANTKQITRTTIAQNARPTFLPIERLFT